MHVLHFLLINGNDATEAAAEVGNNIPDWGDGSWHCIGGVASEDATDDIENHGGGRWGLSWLDAHDGTSFSRAVAYLNKHVTDPVVLLNSPNPTHPDLRSAIADLSDKLRAFDPENGDPSDLWEIDGTLKHLAMLLEARRSIAEGRDIPPFYEWQFDTFGLTDLTGRSEGIRRYLVFLDMHP